MLIIGAGYSGLLAGCFFKDATIFEANTSLQCANKHQAVFRMKSNKVGEYLGIPFKKVLVKKIIWIDEEEVNPELRYLHWYSKKVSGSITERSITNTNDEVRYIPPDDFWYQLSQKSCNIEFSTKINPFDVQYYTDVVPRKNIIPIISTIPLSLILKIRSDIYPEYDIFQPYNKSIFVNRYSIKNCDSYCTAYYPYIDDKIYRATLNGSILIVESLEPLNNSDHELYQVIKSFGLEQEDINLHTSENQEHIFGKISEIDNNLRSKIILELTLKHNIYSLGRYATWRPKVMLDDVFDDIFHIRRLIERGHYASMLYEQENHGKS